MYIFSVSHLFLFLFVNMYLNLRMSIFVFESHHEKMEFKAYGEIEDPDLPAHRAT